MYQSNFAESLGMSGAREDKLAETIVQSKVPERTGILADETDVRPTFESGLEEPESPTVGVVSGRMITGLLMDGKEKVGESNEWRFKLGISPGRWFKNTQTGVVYELTDTVGSGAAATVFKCFRVSATLYSRLGSNSLSSCNSSSFSLEPNMNKLQPMVQNNEGNCKDSISHMEVFAAKAVDLRSLRFHINYENERDKLLREVEILRQLRHPSIVNLVDVVQTADELFLIMELIKGGELFYRIVESGSFSEPQACYILHQVVAAVKYMHSLNIIHRDIKPENILVASELDGYFVVKVADFGLAKLVGERSKAKTFVGTPQYWAPEVIGASKTGESYGKEADLWSMGVLLYVMLGGAYPFDDRMGPTTHLIRTGKFNFQWPRFDSVSKDAKNLICGLLTVDIAQRYTLQQVENDPWMHRWLCDSDRLKLPSICNSHFADEQVTTMPPLPQMQESSFPIDVVISSAENCKYTIESQPRKFSDVDKFLKSECNNSVVNAMQATKSSNSLAVSNCNNSTIFNMDTTTISGIAQIPNIMTSVYSQQFSPISAICNSNVIASGNSCSGYTNLVPFRFFDLDAVMELQLSVASRIQLTALAFRHNAEINKLIQLYLTDCYEMIYETRKVMCKFEQICHSVLNVLPDLSLAISENVPELAIELLTDVRSWICGLKPDADIMQKKCGNLVKNVCKLIISVKDLVAAHIEYNIKVNMPVNNRQQNETADSNGKYRIMNKKSCLAIQDEATHAGLDNGLSSNTTMNRQIMRNCSQNMVPEVPLSQSSSSTVLSASSSVSSSGHPISEDNFSSEFMEHSSLHVVNESNGASASPAKKSRNGPLSLETCWNDVIGDNCGVRKVISSKQCKEGSEYLKNNYSLLPTVDVIRQRLIEQLEMIMKEAFPRLTAAGSSMDIGEILIHSDKDNNLTEVEKVCQGKNAGLPPSIVAHQRLASELLDFLFLSPMNNNLMRSEMSHINNIVSENFDNFGSHEDHLFSQDNNSFINSSSSNKEEYTLGSMIQTDEHSSHSSTLVDWNTSSKHSFSSCMSIMHTLTELGQENIKSSMSKSDINSSSTFPSLSSSLSKFQILPAKDKLIMEACNMDVSKGDGNSISKSDAVSFSSMCSAFIQSSVISSNNYVNNVSNLDESVSTSRLLHRAINELRLVDIILDRCCVFWGNIDCTIDSLCQMKEHTQRLINYSNHPVFKNKVEEKLKNYQNFWESLRFHCHNYVQEITTRSAKIKKFCVFLNSNVDKIDLLKMCNLTEC